MIVGVLFLVLLATREAFRLGDRDAAAVRALNLMLWPVAIGFGLVLAVRVAELVGRGGA